MYKIHSSVTSWPRGLIQDSLKYKKCHTIHSSVTSWPRGLIPGSLKYKKCHTKRKKKITF
jgi:hypothetical protein